MNISIDDQYVTRRELREELEVFGQKLKKEIKEEILSEVGVMLQEVMTAIAQGFEELRTEIKELRKDVNELQETTKRIEIRLSRVEERADGHSLRLQQI